MEIKYIILCIVLFHITTCLFSKCTIVKAKCELSNEMTNLLKKANETSNISKELIESYRTFDNHKLVTSTNIIPYVPILNFIAYIEFLSVSDEDTKNTAFEFLKSAGFLKEYENWNQIYEGEQL